MRILHLLPNFNSPVKETSMNATAVDVRFDRAHLFLELTDGRAVDFPLEWFPILQAASDVERARFAVSLDREQLYWPELDEDINVNALMACRQDVFRHWVDGFPEARTACGLA
ncbi:DUF2442 domain-containing protein [Caballeronia sp. S22]